MNTVDNLILPIITTSITKNQAIRRLRVIKDFTNYLLFDANNSQDFNKVVQNYSQDRLRKHLTDAHSAEDLNFIQSLGIQYFSTFTKVSLNEVFGDISKILDQCKIVTIYIPFELPEQELQKIGGWFKENMGNSVLIELSYDPNLIGGCAMSYQGVYKDFSLSEKIHQNKVQILQSLTSYKQ
jgi:F0F1-type ATP synthase delta subunit